MVAINLFSREQTTPPTVTLAVWVAVSDQLARMGLLPGCP